MSTKPLLWVELPIFPLSTIPVLAAPLTNTTASFPLAVVTEDTYIAPDVTIGIIKRVSLLVKLIAAAELNPVCKPGNMLPPPTVPNEPMPELPNIVGVGVVDPLSPLRRL
jgi:hypothetical protein